MVGYVLTCDILKENLPRNAVGWLTAEVFSHVLRWKSACLGGGTELVGGGRERPCPGGPLVQPELFPISLGTRWGIPSPLRASISGSAGVSTRLGWGYKNLLTGFPPADEDIPISPWGWALFPFPS